jgi:hypothetical protein
LRWKWPAGCRQPCWRRRAAAAAAFIQELPWPSFRLYGGDDVAGVEIGGALKNVIAIAAGVVEDSAWATTRWRRSSPRPGRDLPGWRAPKGAETVRPERASATWC